jgi:chromosome segregation ATPase
LVQSILFFILGVLCAAFLTALVAPAFWRRAVRLTRRRIEATAPLTSSEIAAQKDMLRAEFAVSARRLEMAVKALQEKNARQTVEIARAREDLKAASAQDEETARRIAELESAKSKLTQDIQSRDTELTQLAARMSENEKELARQKLENTRLAGLYEEASFSSSNRQIELVAREAELDRLSADVSALRGRQKDSDARNKETASESRAAREALSLEKKKSTDLDRKLERLMATIADYEDRLDRREKELVALRDDGKGGGAASKPVLKAKPKRRAPAAAGGSQFAQLIAHGRSEDLEAAIGQLAADRDRMEAALVGSDGSDQDHDGALRDELLDLAAEVVALATKIEGPDSPVLAALSKPADGDDEKSLAARAQALLNVAAD